MPIAVRVSGSFEPFDIVYIFIRARVAKIIRYIEFASVFRPPAGIAVNLSAAFFTFKGAMGALKDFANSLDLAFFYYGCLLFFGKAFFIFK